VSQTQICIVPDAVPPIHAVSSHVATDKGPYNFQSILATIYNQLQLAERKHVARYWSILAVPVSAHPSPLVIRTKLAAAIIGSCCCSVEGLCRPSTAHVVTELSEDDDDWLAFTLLTYPI